MKTLCAGLILALIVGGGIPAAAHIVEVSTSVSMPAPATEDDFKDALNAAVKGVLTDVAALKPVVMTITSAYVRAGRLYVRFLIADEVGGSAWDHGRFRPVRAPKRRRATEAFASDRIRFTPQRWRCACVIPVGAARPIRAESHKMSPSRNDLDR